MRDEDIILDERLDEINSEFRQTIEIVTREASLTTAQYQDIANQFFCRKILELELKLESLEKALQASQS